MNIEYLTYEEFGAIGDGITDDMAAIVACHKSANEKKIPVKAKPSATYYIGKTDLTATVKTNTDFSTAKFIIDDRELDLEKRNTPIFFVSSDGEYFTPDIKSLSRNSKKLDFLHTGNVYVRVFSDTQKIYIRKGLNQNNGSNPSDCFIVDADGNVLNEINWEHTNVSKAYAKSADDAPIVISGGVFTTIANQAPSKYTYFHRNFRISRSNVTICGLTHYIVGELDHGAPYEGFISVSECNNFTAENLLLTPHLTYQTESQIPGKLVPMGTYDLSFDAAINVKLNRIRQTVDITDTRYWGLMGSNFSKEVHLDGCVMSRFDAHCGVTNASIKNTTLGHAGLNLIGFGQFLIENSTLTGSNFICFRPDYGSFFDGKLTVRNCIWMPTSGYARQIFFAHNTGDHDFGYKCMLPQSITVDGLTIKDFAADKETKLYVLPNYDDDFHHEKPFEYLVPEVVSISGIIIESGRELELCQNAEQYLNTQTICP